jgi:hypothetical protein
MQGKTKCKFHGGKSTGPVTELGRQICAAAKTVHGKDTRLDRLIEAVETVPHIKIGANMPIRPPLIH